MKPTSATVGKLVVNMQIATMAAGHIRTASSRLWAHVGNMMLVCCQASQVQQVSD